MESLSTEQTFNDSQAQSENKSRPRFKRTIKILVILGVLGIIALSMLLVQTADPLWLHFEPFYSPTKHFYPTLKLPINFVWIGPDPLPQKYVERLKTINFPYKLLGEKEYNEFKDDFNFSADISIGKRADAFRLRYIWKYGGIYSDLDNVIDYQCLMMKFQGLKGTYFSKGQDWHRQPSIMLFYASEPGDPNLQSVTSLAHQRQSQPTLSFMFSYLQHNYYLNSLDLDTCFYHESDGTWGKNDPNPW